jgi:hypothetical protein
MAGAIGRLQGSAHKGRLVRVCFAVAFAAQTAVQVPGLFLLRALGTAVRCKRRRR